MTKAQHVALWVAYKIEKEKREKHRAFRKFVYEVVPSDVFRTPTLRVLEREGLMESFEGTITKNLMRGGRGLIHVGYQKTIHLTKWRFTPKGRKLAATLKTPK